MDFVRFLPRELSERLLSYLPAADLAHFSCCCLLWREIANSDQLWLHHCMVRGWLRHGVNGGILLERTLFPDTTNVSGTSPVFTIQVAACGRLAAVCKWKHVYLRTQHLCKNWSRGRYRVAPILRGHAQNVTAMGCNGHYIASGSSDGMFCIWELSSCSILYKSKVHPDVITDIKIQGNICVTGCVDGAVRLFDCSSGQLLFALHGHRSDVEKVAFHGDHIISVGADRTIKVWSLRERKLKHILRGHEDDVESLSVYHSRMLTGSWDETLILWDLVTGESIFTLTGHSEVVSCSQFDEKIIVSGSADKDLRIWSTKSGHCLSILKGHTQEVYCVLFNEHVIASGSSDSTVRIWSHTGKLLHTCSEHLGVVRCLHIDDERLISGGDQKKIVIWDYKKGKLLNVVHRQPTRLHVMWANDTKLITASPEKPGTITVISYW